MNYNYSKALTNQKGQVLLFVIVIMTVAMSIGVAVSGRTLASLSRVTRDENTSKAIAAAESGIETYLSKSRTDLEALVGQTKTVNFADPVSKIDTYAEVTISKFRSNNTDGSLSFNLSTGQTKELKTFGYAGATVSVCWDNKASALMYTKHSDRGIMTRGILKASDSTINVSDIENATSVNYDNSLKKYCTNIDVSRSMGLRVKALYQDTSAVIYPTPGQQLDYQGYKMVSVGRLLKEGKVITTSTVTAYMSYPYVSSTFDNVIYTEDTLNN